MRLLGYGCSAISASGAGFNEAPMYSPPGSWPIKGVFQQTFRNACLCDGLRSSLWNRLMCFYMFICTFMASPFRLRIWRSPSVVLSRIPGKWIVSFCWPFPFANPNGRGTFKASLQLVAGNFNLCFSFANKDEQKFSSRSYCSNALTRICEEQVCWNNLYLYLVDAALSLCLPAGRRWWQLW